MPAASPVPLIAAESAAGALPLAGETESQDWSSDAVKLSEPPPLLLTLTVCAAGFAAPAVIVNDSVLGETASTGVAGLTVSVTGTVFGEPVAPAAVTVTSVVYVPALRPAMATAAVSVAGAVPEPGVTVSQLADSDAV